MESTPLEFSPEGDFVIHASHDGVLKVWETATNRLKNEYKPSTHLSTMCSCLSWPQTRDDSVRPRKKTPKKKRKSDASNVVETVVETIQAIEDLNLVAIGTISGTILIYSVAKGDLQSQLTGAHTDHGAHTDQVNDIVWDAQNNSLYSCSSDQHIVEWEITSATIKHKWNANQGAVHSLCRCSSKHLLSAGRSIKLWNTETREKIREFVGHGTEVFRMIHIPNLDGSFEKSYFASAAVGDRLLNVWQIDTSAKKRETALASCALTDEPMSIQIRGHIKDRAIIIVVVTKSGKALLFQHTLNGKLKRPLKPKVTLQIASDCGQEEVARPVQILSAFICDEKEHKLLLMHGNHLKPTFEKVPYSTEEPEVCLVRGDPRKLALKKDSSVSKVKTPEVSEDMTMLVPSQMVALPPTQSAGAAIRRKRKTSVGEMAMEDRLNAISLNKPLSGQSEPPKADTLASLLVQGLQSQDKAILDDVIHNRNATLIRNTVEKLPVQMVIALVHELTKRMHGNAQSGSTQVLWIKTILEVHTSYLMTFPEIVDTFSSLYQKMDARVNMFGRLLRLQGKLDIMLSQVSTQTQEEEPITSQPPLLQFEEDSSDDDLDDLAVGGHLSDSEENWENFSEDDDEMDMSPEIDKSKG